MSHKVAIQKHARIFDDFFQIDEFHISHLQLDGTMSADQRWLVFERGDSVAVLLLNVDSKCVMLVRQFKTPAMVGRKRDVKSTTNGWIIEAPAGMIEKGETPEAAIIRETKEETGYQISNPRLIARFFSSPGGSSERIFLYFAEVCDADRHGAGGGLGIEDVEVVQKPLPELFGELRKGLIEDPKLIIGAYWLLEYLKLIGDFKVAVPAAKVPHGRPSGGREPLTHGTVKYALRDSPRLIVGYKTGHIKHVEGVSFWVNSENQDMLMDRFLGKTISANIRYWGSIRDKDGNVTEDIIEESLRTAVGQRSRVEIGTVLETTSGALKTSHGVASIFHVATVKGVGFGQGVKAERSDLAECLNQVLARADQRNRRLWRRLCKLRNHESILVPMLGAGDGGLPVEDAAETIIPPAVRYFQNNPATTLREIYFLAYTSRDKSACDQVLEELRLNGILLRVED